MCIVDLVGIHLDGGGTWCFQYPSSTIALWTTVYISLKSYHGENYFFDVLFYAILRAVRFRGNCLFVHRIHCKDHVLAQHC